MPSNSGWTCLAISVQTPAPKSPPCDTNFSYPRRFISTNQALAVRSGPQPDSVGFAENPNPGLYSLTVATQSISMSNGPAHATTQINMRAGGTPGKKRV